MKYRILQIGDSFYEVQQKVWFWPWWCLEGYYHNWDDAVERLQRLRNPFKPKVLDL